jgi:hypothetical protein
MRALADGDTSGEALLCARQAHARNGHSHPSQWNAMRLEGIGSLRLKLSPAPKSMPWALALLAAIAAGSGAVVARLRARRQAS